MTLPQSTETGSSSNTVAIAVGVSVGVVVSHALVIAIVAAIIMWKKSKSKKNFTTRSKSIDKRGQREYWSGKHHSISFHPLIVGKSRKIITAAFIPIEET